MKTEYKFDFEHAFGRLRVRMSKHGSPQVKEAWPVSANDVLTNPRKYWEEGSDVIVPFAQLASAVSQ